MPRSKDISHYPKEYLTVTESAGFAGKVTVVEVPDMKSALKLRGNYYAFIGQLKRTRESLLLGQKAGAPFSIDDQFLVDVAQAASRVLVSVDEGPPATVTWQNRDNSWQAQLMRQAVTGEGSGAPVGDSPPLPESILKAMKDAEKGK